MVLGSIYVDTLDTRWKGALLKAYTKVVGTSGLHSHIRCLTLKEGDFDQVLLDVLEHLSNDVECEQSTNSLGGGAFL
ncbi:MAG: hypothetical protein ACXV2B_05215 [Halobacteriota archaeon]